MNDEKRYFTSPKVHHIFTEEKNYGVDRNFNHIVDIYNNYEYKHGKGGKSVNGRRYMYWDTLRGTTADMNHTIKMNKYFALSVECPRRDVFTERANLIYEKTSSSDWKN